jgi:putative spermidine/putrescine transport system substrate-binding protein
MDRRTFLIAAMGMPLAAIAVSCRSSTSSSGLSIATLQSSLPLQLIKVFESQMTESVKVNVTPKETLVQLYEALQTWHSDGSQSSGANGSQQQETISSSNQTPADWVTLTDYWLAGAIQQGLIQPIDVETVDGWTELDPLWQQLVQRNRQGTLAEAAPVWGVPYRWSNLAILYNQAKLKNSSVATWTDLLQPELARRLVLPDHPRLVIGLALKALGASANVDNPAAVEGLPKFLMSLQQQVRFYSSDYYLEPLIIGDASAVVGWDVAMLPILDRYHTFAGVIPSQGTLLSADLWVQPTALTTPSPVVKNWLEFSLSEGFAEQLAIYDLGQSPRLWNLAPGAWPEPLQRLALQSTPETLAQSEFIYPLEPAVEERYNQLWRNLRR